MRHLKLLSLITVTLLLTACALSPVQKKEVKSFVLSPKLTIPKSSQRDNLVLLVNNATAAPGFNSNKMIYMQSAHQLEHFINNKWIDSPASMLTSLSIKALNKNAHYRAIVTPPFIGKYNRILNISNLKLLQNYSIKHHQIELSAQVQLLDKKSGRVLRSQTIDVSVPTKNATPYGGVIAANLACVKFLAKLIKFVN